MARTASVTSDLFIPWAQLPSSEPVSHRDTLQCLPRDPVWGRGWPPASCTLSSHRGDFSVGKDRAAPATCTWSFPSLPSGMWSHQARMSLLSSLKLESLPCPALEGAGSPARDSLVTDGQPAPRTQALCAAAAEVWGQAL